MSRTVVAIAFVVLAQGRADAAGDALRVVTDASEDERYDGLPLPLIEARVDARAGLSASDFSLKTAGGETLRAARRRVTAMDLVILVEGNRKWMLRSEFRKKRNARPVDGRPGRLNRGPAHAGVVAAVRELLAVAPEQTRLSLIVYGESPEGPDEWMTADDVTAAIADEERFRELRSYALSSGVRRALALFRSDSEERRRILVVVSDGRDRGNQEDRGAKEEDGDPAAEENGAEGADRESIEALARDLAEEEVEVHVIGYRIPDERSRRLRLLGGDRFAVAGQAAEMAVLAQSIASSFGVRYHALFPAGALVFSGEEQQFQLFLGGESLFEASLVLPRFTRPAKTAPDMEVHWALWGVAGAVLLCALAWGVGRYRRPRMTPAAPGPPLAHPPSQQARAAATAVQAETGIPRVGWVVPLVGVCRYRTFPLTGVATRFGTEGVEVVVEDPFMSAEHAEIVDGPDGFVLNDLGSRNGTFLADRRITSHVLADGDVFVLGSTAFVFKTVI